MNKSLSLRALVCSGSEPDLPFSAVRTLEVELSEPLVAITGESVPGVVPYLSARVLVRLHRQPMGFVDVDLSDGLVSPDELAQQICAELSPQIERHLNADGFSVAEADARPAFPIDVNCGSRGEPSRWNPLVSVIICTMSRPRQLQNALNALLALDYPDFEIHRGRQRRRRPFDREHDATSITRKFLIFATKQNPSADSRRPEIAVSTSLGARSSPSLTTTSWSTVTGSPHWSTASTVTRERRVRHGPYAGL